MHNNTLLKDLSQEGGNDVTDWINGESQTETNREKFRGKLNKGKVDTRSPATLLGRPVDHELFVNTNN